MHPDLHHYLDGHLPREGLPAELRGEAEEWDALLDVAADLRRVRAPAGLETLVMEALPAPPPWVRLWRWLIQPRPIRVRPLTPLLAGAVGALALVTWPQREAASPEAPGVTAARQSVEAGAYVQFVLVNPQAHSVALAGDFNDWNPDGAQLSDPEGNGIWTGSFVVPEGVHQYMFVVDGEHWVSDPRAGGYVDDGFGMRNALVTVAPLPARSS
jgi:hypothetical protein